MPMDPLLVKALVVAISAVSGAIGYFLRAVLMIIKELARRMTAMADKHDQILDRLNSFIPLVTLEQTQIARHMETREFVMVQAKETRHDIRNALMEMQGEIVGEIRMAAGISDHIRPRDVPPQPIGAR